jgi:hypothetical protein
MAVAVQRGQTVGSQQQLQLHFRSQTLQILISLVEVVVVQLVAPQEQVELVAEAMVQPELTPTAARALPIPAVVAVVAA